MLAHNQGGMLNASRLAAALMASAQTVTRYIDLLADLLVVRRLRPFHRNASKHIVKSPKVYIRDSGIVYALLGLSDYNALSGHPVAGASWEGLVVENLPRQTSRWQAFIARPPERKSTLVKKGLSTPPSKGFYIACEDLKPDRIFAVNSGTERHPVVEGAEAIGIGDLASALAAL